MVDLRKSRRRRESMATDMRGEEEREGERGRSNLRRDVKLNAEGLMVENQQEV